jgi:hypothetical protein
MSTRKRGVPDWITYAAAAGLSLSVCVAVGLLFLFGTEDRAAAVAIHLLLGLTVGFFTELLLARFIGPGKRRRRILLCVILGVSLALLVADRVAGGWQSIRELAALLLGAAAGSYPGRRLRDFFVADGAASSR